MKNKIMAMIAIVCILFPRVVKADLDILSHIQDVLSSAEEKTNVLIKQYTGLQFSNITAVTDRDYLRNVRNQFRDQLKSHAMMALRSTSLNHFTMAGMKDNFISGPYANSALLRNINKKYTRRTNMRSDYTATMEHNMRQNRLMVENASTSLAKAIVLRGKMMKELKELEKDSGKTYDQVPVIHEEYKKVAIRANGRWARILVETAEFAELNANGRLADARIKPEDAVEDATDEEEYAAANLPLKNNINLGQAWDLAVNGKGVFETFGSGDIAGGLSGLGGMAGTSGGIFSDQSSIFGQAATGLNTAAGVYSSGANAVNAATEGNWQGLVGNVVGGAGSAVGNYNGAAGSALYDVNNMAQAGFNTSNSVSNGGDMFDTMNAISSGLSNAAYSGASLSNNVTEVEAQATANQAQQQGDAGAGDEPPAAKE